MDDMEVEEEEIILNDDLERKIHDAFKVFDHARNNTVDVRDIGTIIRSLGCCPTDAEVQELIVAKLEDPANPGAIHVTNFIAAMVQALTEHKFEPATPEELLEAFHVLDPLGKGYLTKDFITTAMTQDGEPFNQDELDEMLEIAIDPHTQTVPYEYYINQLMYEPPKENNWYMLADELEAERIAAIVRPKSFGAVLEEMKSKVEL